MKYLFLSVFLLGLFAVVFGAVVAGFGYSYPVNASAVQITQLATQGTVRVLAAGFGLTTGMLGVCAWLLAKILGVLFDIQKKVNYAVSEQNPKRAN